MMISKWLFYFFVILSYCKKENKNEGEEMTVQFVEKYLENKLKENEEYIVCTFYDLKVRHNLSDEDVDKFLEWSRNKLQNIGYKVFFTGAKFVYQNANRTVQDNELMIAIKEWIRKRRKIMNPYNIFDKQEIEKIERIEPLQDREYTKD